MKFKSDHVVRFIYFGLGTGIALVISYLTMYLMNSNLTRHEMGLYSIYFNSLNLLFPIISLSIYSAYLRFVIIYDEKELDGFVKKVLLLSFFIFFIALFVYYRSVYIAFFSFIILAQGRLYFLRSVLNIRMYNVFNVMQKIAFLIGVFFFLDGSYLLNKSELLIFSLGVSYFLVWIFSEFYIKGVLSSSESIDKKEGVDKKIILKFCFVVMCTDIVNWILMVSDQFVIEYYFQVEALAPYAVAFRIVSMVALFTGIFISYYPTMYFRDLGKSDTSEILKFRRVFFVLLFLFCFILFVCNVEIYHFFGADKYIGDIEVFNVLIVGEFFRVSAAVLMTYRTFKLQQYYSLMILCFIAIVNFLLNIIYLPVYGPNFAAYSTCFCFGLYFLVSILVSYFPERKYFSVLMAGSPPDN